MSADTSTVGLTLAPLGSTMQAAANSMPSGQSGGAPSIPSGSNTNASAGLNSIPLPPPHDITIPERFMSDLSWPSDLHLDLAKSNWEEWSFHLNVKSDRLGFTKWLKGTLPQLDATLHPKAHDVWETNDCSLCAFIFEHISKSDYNAIKHLATAHGMFVALQQCHEKLGAHAQVILLKKALNFHYSLDALLCDSAKELLKMYTWIANMGLVDLDQIKIILLLNAFGHHFEHLQSLIYSSMDSPNFGANTILHCFQQEDAMNRACTAQSGASVTALAAQSGASATALAAQSGASATALAAQSGASVTTLAA